MSPLLLCIVVLVHNYSINVTGPAKRDKDGTKYIISQNGKYLEFCVQYLVYVSSNLLPIKLCVYDKTFYPIALADY